MAIPRAFTRRPRRPGARCRLLVETLEDRCLLSVTIGVDAGANVHPIDPNIYGTAFATTAQLSDLNVPLNRDGGNASETYSFQQDATNHASDWFFESIASGSGNGQVWIPSCPPLWPAAPSPASPSTCLTGRPRSGPAVPTVASIVASPEFASRANALIGGANADANFVQALYQLLLRRTAAPAEVQPWLPGVAAAGRQAVAGAILDSVEFRGDAVRTFYGDPSLNPLPWEPFFINLLHRTPSAAEISGWANTSIDFVTMEVLMAGSQEYYDLH
jgi:Domain of unknown function (DUF4214)/Planctomycete extracellular